MQDEFESMMDTFLDGKPPRDLPQKIYQNILQFEQAVNDLLNIAMPEIWKLKPKVKAIVPEALTISAIERQPV